MLNSEDGIEPVRLAELRDNVSKLPRFPISGGISPAKQFWLFRNDILCVMYIRKVMLLSIENSQI